MPKKFFNPIVISVIVILTLVISLFGIAYFYPKSQTNQASNSKIQVVTSFYPLEFLAREIGKDLVTVQNITPAGTEVHEYEPTQQQIIDISKSDLLLLNGAGLESWSKKITEINPAPKNISDLSKSFQLTELDEEGQKIQDPHIWLSPKNYIRMTQVITTNLQKNQNQDTQAKIKTNSQVLIQKLENLERDYRSQLTLVNCTKTKFLTNHDAFNYLARDYNLEAIAINGLSPESEPTTQELANLASIVKSENIKYIMTETTSSPKLAITLASQADIKTLELNPLEGLSQEDIESGKNYITEMTSNLKNLAIALECKPL